MLFDVVHEVQAQAEPLVLSRLKQVEGDVEELKRGLKALTDEVKENLGKLQHFAFDSILDAAGYANTLKQWTGKATASVVYDSNVCPFTYECLFQMVKGKPNIAIIATTTDGDVFGGFYNRAVTEQDKRFRDPNMFIFSFESHGRCKTPKRFVLKKSEKGDATMDFYKFKSGEWKVNFDCLCGGFYLGNEKSRTFCYDLSKVFVGIDDTTLTGKDKENFTCCRLVAIQLV